VKVITELIFTRDRPVLTKPKSNVLEAVETRQINNVPLCIILKYLTKAVHGAFKHASLSVNQSF